MAALPHSTPLQRRSHSGRLRLVAIAVAVSALAATLALTQQGPQSPQQPASPSVSQPRAWAASLPDASRVPDANDQMQMQEQHSKSGKYEVANAERRKQISDDAARLLELATELKTAVDKTDKDTLSLDVIRKAESIEKLAKGVKEKMKLTVGAS